MVRRSADRPSQESSKLLAMLVPEGIEVMVPQKSSVHTMLPQITGGLRVGMGMAGFASIEPLRTEPSVFRFTAVGLKESHAHDVLMPNEAPNYRSESPDSIDREES